MVIKQEDSQKIWIFNHYATNMYNDEGGRHYEFAAALLSKGFSPTIFCSNIFHTHQESVYVGNEKFKIKSKHDIPFVFIKSSPYNGNGLSRVINMFSFAKNLYKIGREFQKEDKIPDVILASSVHPLTLVTGVLLSKKFRVPLISEIRDLWPEAILQFKPHLKNTPISWVLEKGEKWIYDNSDAIIFTKEGDKDYLYEQKWITTQGGSINPRKIFYINNGVNYKKFNSLKKIDFFNDVDLNSSKFKVTYVGAIRPINNIDNILDTAKLLQKNSEIIFLIYGEGIEKERLEKRIIDESIKNVKFKGFVNKNKIPFILSKSSVNLLNYSDNQFNWSRGNSSNKLFEYMASGKPIISTTKMGYSIIDKYQCGTELEKNSPKHLARAITKYFSMGDYDNSIIKCHSINGALDFDYEKLTEKLIKVINKVVSNYD